MSEYRKIRVESDGQLNTTRIIDTETGEDLTDKYPISNVYLELEDGVWVATLTVLHVEVAVVAGVGRVEPAEETESAEETGNPKCVKGYWGCECAEDLVHTQPPDGVGP